MLAIAGSAMVCLLVVAAVFVLSARSGDETDEPDEPGDRGARAELVVAPKDLVVALGQERTLAVLTLLGVEDVAELPVETNDAARRETDTALATFRGVVADADPAGGAAYRNAFDVLQDLSPLRATIDSRAQPPALSEMPYATLVQSRYRALVAALLAASSRFVATTDDDVELHHGAVLFKTALEQVERVALLGYELVAAEGNVDTPDEVRRLSELTASSLRAGPSSPRTRREPATRTPPPTSTPR